MGCQGLPHTPTYLHNVESKDPPGTHTFPHGYELKLLIPQHGWSTKKHAEFGERIGAHPHTLAVGSN